MLNKLRLRLKDWLGVYALEQENEALKRRLTEQSKRLDKRIAELDRLTKVDVDVGMRGPCTIILSGVYQGKGYCTFYEVSIDQFKEMVDRYKRERKEHLIRNIDAPYGFIGSFDL